MIYGGEKMKKRILMAVLSASMLAAMPASAVSAQVSVAVSQEAMTGQWYGNYKGCLLYTSRCV